MLKVGQMKESNDIDVSELEMALSVLCLLIMNFYVCLCHKSFLFF